MRSLFMGGGSTYDVNGYSTSFAGAFTDVQRTLTVTNSNTGTTGAVSFNGFDYQSTATLALGANNALNLLSSNPGSASNPQSTTVTLGGYTLTLNGGTASTMPDFQGNITGPGALVVACRSWTAPTRRPPPR